MQVKKSIDYYKARVTKLTNQRDQHQRRIRVLEGLPQKPIGRMLEKLDGEYKELLSLVESDARKWKAQAICGYVFAALAVPIIAVIAWGVWR